jgi:hypothetical protein
LFSLEEYFRSEYATAITVAKIKHNYVAEYASCPQEAAHVTVSLSFRRLMLHNFHLTAL